MQRLLNLLIVDQPITAVKWASDFWGYIDQNQNDIAKSFVQDIEAHLGIKHTKISFAEEWARHPPPEADGKALDEYMVPVSEMTRFDSIADGREGLRLDQLQ